MIVLYTGVPGSGKSYKMVHDLASFLEKNPDINVISNIRNLKIGHTNFDDYLLELFPGIKLSQQVEKFFNYEHQEKLNEKFGGPIMYVLDECQLYFPRRTSLTETEAYLQRHRHLGHYIYMATQAIRLVNSNFIPLIETEFHAARRTISFFGEIHYKEKSPQSNHIVGKMTLRPKQEIFDLYQSFEAAEIKKPRPALFKFFLLPLLLTPLFYVFYDKYLKVPVKEERRIESLSAVPSPEIDKLKRQTDFLRSELSATQAKVESLTIENARLRDNLEQKVRVFLPVVQQGNKKLTVDPETGAVIEPSKIKGHKVTCISNGNDITTCYYDKPVYGGVQLHDSYSGRNYGTVTATAAPAVKPEPEGKAGPGSFIDPSMFEGLERLPFQSSPPVNESKGYGVKPH